MKKGTLLSLIVAAIALTGAVLGLVAYLKSRRCYDGKDLDDEYMPELDEDFPEEYYTDDSCCGGCAAKPAEASEEALKAEEKNAEE
ncbi:MAG: hypothetical protein PHE09_11830 [Oscillospiraceae bacterium]|nr:hypothetical protein [Oscillospiraceae bacterium]